MVDIGLVAWAVWEVVRVGAVARERATHSATSKSR